MFNKVSVPVLGIIENMSYHVCSACGHHEHCSVPVVARRWRSSTGGAVASCRCINASPTHGRWLSDRVRRPDKGGGRSYLKLARRVS
jgi:hypothetical protein